MNYLGHHIILDFHDCNPQILSDCNVMKTVMGEAARKANCTIVGEFYHEFEPHGISGCTIISESHFTIHAWPEHGYAAVDMFYCGDNVDIAAAETYLSERFESTRVERHELARGAIEGEKIVLGSKLIDGEDFAK